MALKAVLTKAEVDGLPEAVRTQYAEKNGSYELQVEGGENVTELKNKVAEFRNTNVTVMRERDELKVKLDLLKDIDPVKYRAMSEEIDTLKSRGINKPEDVQAAIDKAMKPVKDALAAAEQREKEAQAKVTASKFKDMITADATKAGVAPSAIRHVIREAESTFELNTDGELVPRKGVKHPTEPHKDLTPGDWLQHLSKTDPFLFGESTGTGATGAPKPDGGGKPGAKKLINPSPEEMGRHMDSIAKGETIVVRQ